MAGEGLAMEGSAWTPGPVDSKGETVEFVQGRVGHGWLLPGGDPPIN